MRLRIGARFAVLVLIGVMIAVLTTSCSRSTPRSVVTIAALGPLSICKDLPAIEQGTLVGSVNAAAKGAVTVDPDPIAATEDWGTNPQDGNSCQQARTRSGEAFARRLANDVRQAKSPPSGTRNCPGRASGVVRLVFQYASGRLEVADAVVVACGSLLVPGRHGLELSGSLIDDLHQIAPPEWKNNI